MTSMSSISVAWEDSATPTMSYCGFKLSDSMFSHLLVVWSLKSKQQKKNVINETRGILSFPLWLTEFHMIALCGEQTDIEAVTNNYKCCGMDSKAISNHDCIKSLVLPCDQTSSRHDMSYLILEQLQRWMLSVNSSQ